MLHRRSVKRQMHYRVKIIKAELCRLQSANTPGMLKKECVQGVRSREKLSTMSRRTSIAQACSQIEEETQYSTDPITASSETFRHRDTTTKTTADEITFQRNREDELLAEFHGRYLYSACSDLPLWDKCHCQVNQDDTGRGEIHRYTDERDSR